MDATRFDALTRSLTSGSSRRCVLGRIAGVLLAALPAGQDTTAKRKCPPSRPVRCRAKCCHRDETCQRGQCVHHCRDGIKNRGETDVDCGVVCHAVLGASPFGRCDIHQRCAVDDDCRTGICREVQPGAGTICVECRTDVQCGNLSETPRCINHFCFACAGDFDCHGVQEPFCVAAADCPNNEPCECVQCRTDDDCEAADVCVNGFCSECRTSANCPPARPVCDQNHDCIAA